MVKITKTMQDKHLETLSPFVREFQSKAESTPLPLLPQLLSTFPSRWPFPKGDLYHWLSLLNRFDGILERFCAVYKLDVGPQTIEFECTLLKSPDLQGKGAPDGEHDLEALGYGSDGDRMLLESILKFSCMLLEKCGNRAVYASSPHLNSLLNTTSLSLLEATLLCSLQCAKRYAAALKRNGLQNSRNPSPALLTSHYSIDLNRVLQISSPFTTNISISNGATPQQTAIHYSPSAKGKPSSLAAPGVLYATNLALLATGSSRGGNITNTPRKEPSPTVSGSPSSDWDKWGNVKISYYPKTAPEDNLPSSAPPPLNTTPSAPLPPVTPTPIRRSSNLGPNAQRVTPRISTTDESPSSARSANSHVDETPRQNVKTIDIPCSKLKSAGVHALVQEFSSDLPQALQYELLTKLRAASALTTSLDSRRQILAVRILAITNLAYTYSETQFHDNVMKQDSDEPKRLQLTYQLADLIHPPSEGEVPVPRALQTLVLSALDGIGSHQSKFGDVCKALNTNISHGVLLYVLRNAVAELSEEDLGDKADEGDDWREAWLSLLHNLTGAENRESRDRNITALALINAGLIPILVEALTLQSSIARRFQPKLIAYMDTILFISRESFQAFVDAKGLEEFSNLIVRETTTSAENATAGKGMPLEYRSPSIDYEVPFYQQQTLKWIFKTILHMMTSGGLLGANFDRLLRNLIDTPQLLGSLRTIIGNVSCYGSNIWSNSVGVLNGFINNEPTSFAIIAEAGLGRGFLEAITCSTIVLPPEPAQPKGSELPQPLSQEAPSSPAHDDAAPSSQAEDDSDNDEDDRFSENDEELLPGLHSPRLRPVDATRDGRLASGIMPTTDTINIIPQAFSALCLNSGGMKMFRASRALEIFFEIFESAEHVKCMNTHGDLPGVLGQAFDELVRHHPTLKAAIINSILDMVARVGHLCKTRAAKDRAGARLLTHDSSGQVVIADDRLLPSSFDGKGKAVDNGSDVEMPDLELASSQIDTVGSADSEGHISMVPYIACVANFLASIFHNNTIRSEFIINGGVEYVLDLADSACLPYRFDGDQSYKTLHTVIGQLAEQKPHLVVPSLLKRAQGAADVLAPFANHTGDTAYLAPFISSEAHKSTSVAFLAKGTGIAKAMVNILSLVHALQVCFQSSPYAHRTPYQVFNAVNLADYYDRLVRSLGPLLSASLKEEKHLKKLAPDTGVIDNRIRTAALSLFASSSLVLGTPSNGDALEPKSAKDGVPSEAVSGGSVNLEGNLSPYIQNFEVLEHLLEQLSPTITPFFQNLGKALFSKRNLDTNQKQSHVLIAEALAETVIKQLQPPKVYSSDVSLQSHQYWVKMIKVMESSLVEHARHMERPVQINTLVLQAFKDKGGFTSVNRLLEFFEQEIRESHRDPEDGAPRPVKTADQQVKITQATMGIKSILSLYAMLVSAKNINESTQTVAMVPREHREAPRDKIRHPEQFYATQFTVEIRYAILPHVRRLWESNLLEKAPSGISEKLIEVIRTICAADNEAPALKRSEDFSVVAKPAPRTMRPAPESVDTLVAQCDCAEDLAKEALIRSFNAFPAAMDYVKDQKHTRSGGRHPLPAEESKTTSEASQNSTSVTDTDIGIETPPEPSRVAAPSPFGLVVRDNADESTSEATPDSGSASAGASRANAPAPSEGQQKYVTVDDLNEERALIKDELIDKCLDVINAHGDVTFEIADLITTVVAKSSEPTNTRKSIAETLVVALMSFAGEDDLQKVGKKVASYAHLLALMLRDKDFYAAAVGELRENLATLLAFVKLSPNHSAEEPSPWIAHVLLIVEMLLSKDAKPRKTQWTAPKAEGDKIETPVLEAVEPVVPEEERSQLLEAILEILPRIGKEESLALSVLRILVVLSRTRSVAQAMGEKKNIQRLFVMAKQLAGASNARIQSPMLLILRHIIEDEETVKQIMRSDIKSFFDTSAVRTRSIDLQVYLRSQSHSAIRSPELFVEVTNEMVKFHKWSFSGEGPSRPHAIVLKSRTPPIDESVKKSSDDSVQPAVQATEDLTLQDIKPSTEAAVDSEMPDATKPAAPEAKLPVIENPDGVIHFLLCELMNYKDVEDNPTLPAVNPVDSAVSPSTSDTSMSGTSSSSGAGGSPALPASSASSEAAVPKEASFAKPAAKQAFKAEEHPIYIYRCFLLQCLTELLGSYNRTKIEFINFKRSAPPQAMTPSKPRSSVVNYLLWDLIPVGTLEHADTTALKKKSSTSSWADSVLSALLSKTGEQSFDKNREKSDPEDEPDLLFVRRFVLENILKAYRDASASAEPLDIKYGRMLSLAELMSHIMAGRDSLAEPEAEVSHRSQLQLRRIMFEKGFITALTASVAEIDLNYPGAKRAVKYILRPLKVLTLTASTLSNMGLISAVPGQAEDDEIESASDVSDDDDEGREETPDLFRNSTLGMFEQGDDEDDSSGSEDDDEDMEYDEYEEGLEYEEEMVEDDEDNVSDEEEDIEGMGQIEGLSGDHGVVEVIMEDGSHDEDDDDDDDEESSDDDEDSMDDGEDDDAHIEIQEELEDQMNDAGEDDENDDWDDIDGADEEEDYEGQEDDEDDAAHIHSHAHAQAVMDEFEGPLGDIGHFARALGMPADGAVEILQQIEDRLGDEGDDLGLDYDLDDGDMDDQEEDDEDMEMADELLFEHMHPGAAHGRAFMGWEDAEDPGPVPVRRAHRHGGMGFFQPGPRDPLSGMFDSPALRLQERLVQLAEALDNVASGFEARAVFEELSRDQTNPRPVPADFRQYRSHRPGGAQARATDDGTNPLLRRGGAANRDAPLFPSRPAAPGGAGGWISAVGPGGQVIDLSGHPFAESPAAMLEVIRNMRGGPGAGAHIHRSDQGLEVHIAAGPGGTLPREIEAMLSGSLIRPPRMESRRDVTEPSSATHFHPQSTIARWIEESRMLFGVNGVFERAADLTTALLAVLTPPAVEEEIKRARLADEEKKRIAAALAEKMAKEAEEKAAKEKKEAEEREAREKEEKEAIEKLNAEAAAIAASAVYSETDPPEEMDGVEAAPEVAVEQPEAPPAADRPRVTTVIRGQTYDITELGVDPEFLDAMPEEIREEVIMSAVADRRINVAVAGGAPSDIDQEFLDALPEDIRAEIIQQERADRRRRDREAAGANRRGGAAAPGGDMGEMDIPTILATFDPEMRRDALLGADEDLLAALPPDLAAQAREFQRRDEAAHGRAPVPRSRIVVEDPASRTVTHRRPMVQLLEKSGVATLLRLMFMPQSGSLRASLHSVLEHAAMNRINRAEIISSLLHILQDGSADMTAVERSFAHLSLKAKQPKDTNMKTPTFLSRKSTMTSLGALAQPNPDVSPLMVVQQCLSALIVLSVINVHISSFFLTEHEPSGGLKRSLSRKGKGKDTKAARYPLNALLSLLDRDLIMESSTVMEQLSALLNTVTFPLVAMERKQKEVEEAEKAKAKVEGEVPSVTSPETATTDDQSPAAEQPETPPAQADASTTEAAAQAEPSKTESVKEDKKPRVLSMPVVPENNLRLVTNIFCSECNSKTFRETISTIKNLSTIPGAKAVFGKELVSKAQALGEIILKDLVELLPQIEKAQTGTEIQGVALAKFSPPASDQHKLLRVLTALDHLFDPKREKKSKPDANESSQLEEKQDLLATLYENSTFAPMWEKLSACLGAIKEREHMLSVATILLPLIESLMVVCKNTTLKEGPIAGTQKLLEATPARDSQMENLFFSFTEEHRKILNDLVRQNPKLMSGTFALLVKNPKVLEFDNKRNFFTRSIHTRSQTRHPFPALQLSVRRNVVFHDSFKALYFKTGDEMKYGKLSIRFHGEEGVDAGGVTREWFQVLSRQMFDPGYALFIPVSSDRTTFHPNALSSVNEEHLLFFKFIGRIIGKALYEGRVLDCHFSRALYKRILGKPVSMKDMESLDPNYYKSLTWMLENDITDIMTESFSIDNDKFGVVETVDLIENGRNINTTEENKHEYARLMTEWKLTGSVKEQLDNFLGGFHDIIPAELIAIFNEQELELLISGLPEIDVDDWKANTEYHNYSASSPQIQWFWRALRSFDKEEKAKLLQFVTGTSKVPLNGFKELEGMNGFTRFNIHRISGSDRLLSSHTCFNQLDLPEYPTYEKLRAQVLLSITAGADSFGFA